MDEQRRHARQVVEHRPGVYVETGHAFAGRVADITIEIEIEPAVIQLPVS